METRHSWQECLIDKFTDKIGKFYDAFFCKINSFSDTEYAKFPFAIANLIQYVLLHLNNLAKYTCKTKFCYATAKTWENFNCYGTNVFLTFCVLVNHVNEQLDICGFMDTFVNLRL